jgi:OOP family OmpA-OmpF porin
MTFARNTISRAAGKFSLLTLALMASPFAWADDAGWYAGANLGQSSATIDDAGIARGLLNSGLTAGPINNVNHDLGFKIFGGYQFNKNFALEGGYFDLGQFGFSTSTIPPGSLSGTIKLRGINLDAVGTLPVTDRLSVMGRIGVAQTQASDSFVGTGVVNVRNANPSSRETNLKIGLGLQYALTQAWSVRAEIERYRIDDAVGNKGDVDLVSVGLVYRFGAQTAIPVAHAYVAAPVEITPAPVVVVLVPPPLPLPPSTPPVPIKVSFTADSLFDFDNSTGKPVGRLELDKLVAELKGG